MQNNRTPSLKSQVSLPALLVALLLLNPVSAQTLADLAAAQSAKQTADFKKATQAATSAITIIPIQGGSSGPNTPNILKGSVIDLQKTNIAPPIVKPVVKGPVVHSIVKKQNGEVLIELADKGRLIRAAVGMSFGDKKITRIASDGITLTEPAPMSADAAKPAKPTAHTKKINGRSKQTVETTATPQTNTSVTRTVGLGGSL